MYRTYWLTLAIVLIAINSFGQISFKKGYYIDSQGEKTECLIKDTDWKNAPSSFSYKMNEDSDVQKMETKDITEFAVGDTKYIRAHVQYDQSSQELSKITTLSNPDWAEGDLLLKVIVEGKATLYAYEDPHRTLFFFSVNKSSIEQLVFKNYMPGGDITTVAANKMYLSQINGKVRCMGVTPVNDKQVPYQQRPLAKHFLNYNICSGEVVTKAPTKAKSFSLRITPGVDFTNVTGNYGTRNYEFGNNTSFRLGVEGQFTLPFQHGKWAVIIEPTYQSFKSAKDGGLKYSGIGVPMGIRHRFFLNEKSSIFVNAAAFVEVPFEHSQTIGPSNLKVDNAIIGFAGGAGFSYGRFSLEGRYYPRRERNVAGVLLYHYTNSTVILGFRVF